ncbi:transcription antitermination factor NusB [Gulosibacter molinativorax]|uniref:Transcription antitermination protein NusB n=1 Tax=Gulosibacter molinativorax TaxID=256821 RepID=A0ABT7C7E0_9MICO|nr:transcription antitermination factor NusB [Gulosibacter molinativorax]MDJ1371062.1 transcription antitermination factor NusB [Gulosibacter molinativorax]QUY61422.1 N utilization substance protein B homolog [Gulosibacter molinativorax]
MSARTKARKRALDMLFQADLVERPLAEVLADEQVRAAGEPEREASWRYARQIVSGVAEHFDDIDTEIEATSREWRLERMPRVDRAILRIGVWEIRYNEEVPNAVAIAEAVSSATEYSTEDSSRFINGVLGRIADRHTA